MYRALQQWDIWLTEFLGSCVLDAEKTILLKNLSTYFGKQGLLIGVPHQNELLKASVTAHQMVLTPLISKTRAIKTIESEFEELPIAPGSIDLVLLPHTLEYTHNPRNLLIEACRIVKPEGHLIILGFNPWSLWGLKRLMTHAKKTPWSSRFINASTIKKWLNLADFELEKHETLLFRPPLKSHGLFHKLKFLVCLGKICYWGWGGVYLLIVKAKVTPLTPIRLRWQQSLPKIRVTLPGPTMQGYK